MLGFALGLVAQNAGEWLAHKHVLHGMAREKDSFWAFHWYEHHKESRRNDFYDPHYERHLFGGLHAQSKEALGLLAAGALVLPLLPVAPGFTSGFLFGLGNYYWVHKKSHNDPEWAKRHLPWHYDHHMGPNQHANWCVTFPLFDHLMGTREPYLGTAREAKDRARAARRAAARAVAA